MVTKEEYAQLSLYVYNTKIDDNRPNRPDGWGRLEYVPNGAFGFSYGVFQRDGTNEVVVAYTGTQMTDVGDLANDATAGLGLFSTQAVSAALAYVDAKQKYGDNISLTGHSLGGGLAISNGRMVQPSSDGIRRGAFCTACC